MNLLLTEANLIFTKPLLVMSFLQPKAFKATLELRGRYQTFDYNYEYNLDRNLLI